METATIENVAKVFNKIQKYLSLVQNGQMESYRHDIFHDLKYVSLPGNPLPIKKGHLKMLCLTCKISLFISLCFLFFFYSNKRDKCWHFIILGFNDDTTNFLTDKFLGKFKISYEDTSYVLDVLLPIFISWYLQIESSISARYVAFFMRNANNTSMFDLNL